jgi:ribonuclease HI
VWTIWVDGSGTTGGPAGVAYYACHPQLANAYQNSLSLPNATNQQAEILAAAFALHELAEKLTQGGGCDVTIVSDSEYVVRGRNEWLPPAIARGWRRSTGGPVANQRHWERLLEAERYCAEVKYVWTKGHAGTVENEIVDQLAGLARQAALASVA